jgi:hypothetical protein
MLPIGVTTFTLFVFVSYLVKGSNNLAFMATLAKHPFGATFITPKPFAF